MRVELLRLVRTLNRECKGWIDAELWHVGYTFRPVDMPQRVSLLHYFVSIAEARVVLPAAMYELEGDHDTIRLVVESEGVSFVTLHLPRGVRVSGSLTMTGRCGSLTMTKCTSTGRSIDVEPGASLVTEDTLVFGNSGWGGGGGVSCRGEMTATRCIVDDNRSTGVSVIGGSAELVDCVIRKNGHSGLCASN